MKTTTCCFFGHREINETEELKADLSALIEKLITESKVDTFLFGSKSRFNDLCYKAVTAAKEKHPHVKRIYVRAEYPQIDEDYKNYLLERYEDTYFPERIIGAHRAVYVERNCDMIDRSRYCVVYCDENVEYPNRRSGTKTALEYALKNGACIFNLAGVELATL